MKRKIKRWMNVYPHDKGFERAVLFPTKELANSFAVPGILACVPVTYEVGRGLDHIEIAELKRVKQLRRKGVPLAAAVERAHTECYVNSNVYVS